MAVFRHSKYVLQVVMQVKHETFIVIVIHFM
jgi:hypothetical protein